MVVPSMTTAQLNDMNMNSKKQQHWNFEPELPIEVSPLFIWPLNLKKIAMWFWSSWLLISEKLIILGIALISWLFFHPALEQCKQLDLNWVSLIFFRNLALMIFIAGGLHHVFLHLPQTAG